MRVDVHYTRTYSTMTVVHIVMMVLMVILCAPWIIIRINFQETLHPTLSASHSVDVRLCSTVWIADSLVTLEDGCGRSCTLLYFQWLDKTTVVTAVHVTQPTLLQTVLQTL